MNRTSRLAALALTSTIAVAGAIGTAPSAHAGQTMRVPVDHRPCVAASEYQSLQALYDNTDGTRATIEARWEVHGYGKVSLPYLGTSVVYPRCGFKLSRSFIAVAYDAHGVVVGDALVTQ